MTEISVVDASALAALVFGEAEAIAARPERVRLVAPALLGFEQAKVCLTRMRREPAWREALRAAFRLVDRLAVETVSVDHGDALDLAAATGLTAYEASHLWLARALGGN